MINDCIKYRERGGADSQICGMCVCFAECVSVSICVSVCVSVSRHCSHTREAIWSISIHPLLGMCACVATLLAGVLRERHRRRRRGFRRSQGNGVAGGLALLAEVTQGYGVAGGLALFAEVTQGYGVAGGRGYGVLVA